MKPIVLFGGTFDPVHVAHVAMARSALQELAAARLVILPAGNPYQRGRMPFASAAHRVAMLGLAFADEPRAEIDPRELIRAGPTYTLDTLREYREVSGEMASLVWLLGGDAFARLDSWHHWDRLLDFAHFAIVLRQDQPSPLTAASAALRQSLQGRQADAAALGSTPAGQYTILEATVPVVSSTQLRARCRNNESLRGLVPGAVCDYIEQHQLYHSKE